ncbi:MAG TPA: hypothetical protein VN493_10250 [Thermoanaerobaculia bacterium]|nr:hypothetical protein [Thermoanaerobaculia bacterium]
MEDQIEGKEDQERKEENPPPNQPHDQRIDHDDSVEEASDESFPASDPPGSY